MIEANIIPATSAIAQQLLISTGSEVVSLLRLRKLDDVPVMVNQSWLPHVYCPGILKHDFNQVSLYEILLRDYDQVLSRSVSTIGARLASRQEIKWLDLDSPGVLLTMEQITFTKDDRPIEMSLMLIHPTRYPLTLTHESDCLTMEPTPGH